MQSKCPQCHTAFRVNEEQLSIADGKVRCGQCMHVFLASEHFIEEPEQAETEDVSLAVTDEITIPDIEASNVERPDDISIDELTPTEIDSVEIEFSEIDMTSFDSIDIDKTDDADNIEDISDDEETLEEENRDVEEKETEEGSVSEDISNIQSSSIYEINSPMAAANETWQEPEPTSNNEESAEHDGITIEEAADSEQITEEVEEDAELNDVDETIPLLVDRFDAKQLYPELDAAPNVGLAKYTGLYSIAIIALLAIFSLQAIYLLRDKLAEQAALRPMMSSFCANFNCALSLPREPERILLTSSEVRSHPSEKQALLVKASMQNQARFRQAYPILRLQFSDLEGNALIARDFLPNEYLPSDVSISSGMPINIDINLSLELLDPGGQAVSFDFSLL